MDTLTIFGDIHANLPALEAVLADMDARALPNRACLGDLVGYGTWPNEVVALIQAAQIPTIMGNYDQGVGQDSDDCGCAYKDPISEALGKRSIAWSNTHTTAEHKAFLRTLSDRLVYTLGDLRVVLVHGSPRKINEYLFEDRPASSLERLLDQVTADVLVCGHTHLPYHRVLPSGRHVINAGSVGKPKDGDPRAGYVVLRAIDRDLHVEFIRVSYDIERVVQAIEATTMPHEYAQMLRAGRG
ncbi:metallophosphoesterase family protein [Herpetosiphon geysericola]|uniref:Serine/threonine protein phosphatase n=1 Tax=Herpetosiphon geysericola TaxID=70996 RepID=A0A0P6YLH8_9CHLR|nr:metallophosphoesterase family protein [Herpetosiphon geysericola]KPL91475.1 serine/threonine protein phosphatase [Herpetosiphon geysericola]